jgi:hypothetical protein
MNKEEESDEKLLVVKDSIDKIKESRKVPMSEEEFERIAIEKYEEPTFTDHHILVFTKRLQNDGTYKVLTTLGNNKICFPDQTEDVNSIELGKYYHCWVHEPKSTEEKPNLGRVAFARIICEVYIPKVFISENWIYTMVWRDNKGNTRRDPETVEQRVEMLKLTETEKKIEIRPEHKRLLLALLRLKETGTPSVEIVFQENRKKLEQKK